MTVQVFSTHYTVNYFVLFLTVTLLPGVGVLAWTRVKRVHVSGMTKCLHLNFRSWTRSGLPGCRMIANTSFLNNPLVGSKETLSCARWIQLLTVCKYCSLVSPQSSSTNRVLCIRIRGRLPSSYACPRQEFEINGLPKSEGRKALEAGPKRTRALIRL
jgi:hypothetical protein